MIFFLDKFNYLFLKWYRFIHIIIRKKHIMRFCDYHFCVVSKAVLLLFISSYAKYDEMLKDNQQTFHQYL